jgi:hypothetical protein
MDLKSTEFAPRQMRPGLSGDKRRTEPRNGSMTISPRSVRSRKGAWSMATGLILSPRHASEPKPVEFSHPIHS